MIRVSVDGSGLSPEDRKWLVEAQQKIDAQATYLRQKAEAERLWKSKSKAVFRRIKQLLQAANVGLGYCNYCEQNEPGDVDHFFPKKLFPEKAFLLENYLFACPQCNQRSKGERFAVFESHAPVAAKRFEKGYAGPHPISDQAAVINPLVEDPLQLMFRSLKTGFLGPYPIDLDEAGVEKAMNTIWMVRLNDRDILVEQRRESAGIFTSYLADYIRSKSSQTYDELAAFVKFPEEVDRLQPFELAKEKFLRAQIKKIQDRPHRTVWEEMKRQRKYHKELEDLFDAAPEALDW